MATLFDNSLGPSLQLYPTRQCHLDVVPLFGISEGAPSAEVVAVFGYEF